MIPHAVELMMPRILVVDDERQIHASLRLRLGREYELVFSSDAHDALAKVREQEFDLCFADIHMPKMDGLTFIEAARKADSNLGFVVISAFDSEENLRRAIPLQVFDFVAKPLPERHDFEALIPGWVGKTRQRRRHHELTMKAGALASDRETARLERDVELTASESARDALLQAASLLTTIHAHLVSVTTVLAARTKTDSTMTHILRSLEEARKTTDAAMTVTGGFFDSAYGNRDTSPALINAGIQHAIGITRRVSRADDYNKAVDFLPVDDRLNVSGLSGIEFLLMMTAAIGVAVARTARDTTVGIRCEPVTRLEAAMKEPRLRSHLWLNRKQAVSSHCGVLIYISATAVPLTRLEFEQWSKGEYTPLSAHTPRGMIAGVQKCHGLLGLTVAPQDSQFKIVLALPT